MIGQLVFSYRVIREVGRGGMGVVYEAVNETFGQRAALKCLSRELITNVEAVSRFIIEARAASAVQHPSLVRIFNCDRLADGSPYILMEFLHGESVRSRAERMLALGEHIPLADVLRINRAIASALDAVHHRGIIHRDLKPSNVILVPGENPGEGETVKVVDFGIAKIIHKHEDAAARQTTEGKFLGTAIYASPEQCRMEGRIGTASDVYSLGIMFYEMLAGRPPFLGGIGAVLGAQLFMEPPPLRYAAPLVPNAVQELVHDMLRKGPEQRPSMAMVVTRLDAIQRGEVRAGSAPSRRGPLWLGASCALLLAGGVLWRWQTLELSAPPITAERTRTPPTAARGAASVSPMASVSSSAGDAAARPQAPPVNRAPADTESPQKTEAAKPKEQPRRPRRALPLVPSTPPRATDVPTEPPKQRTPEPPAAPQPAQAPDPLIKKIYR